MKDLIQKILAKIAELRQEANGALAKLQPMEQNEGAQECAAVFRAARYCIDYLKDIGEQMEGKVKEFAEEIRVAIRAELQADETFRQEIAKDPKVLESIKQELLKGGEFLTKLDHEGKLSAAESAAEKKGKEQAEKASQDQKLITDRRAEAAKAFTDPLKKFHGDKAGDVATEVASKLSDDDLKGDGYKTKIETARQRLDKCLGVGVSKGTVLQEAVIASDELFGKLQEGWKDVYERASSGSVRAPLAARASSSASSSNDDDATKDEPILV